MEHAPTPTFATDLRRIRHERKLSQEQLAHDAEVDRAYMSRVEPAVTYVGLEIIGKLAAIVGSSRPSSSDALPVQIPEEGRLNPMPSSAVS